MSRWLLKMERGQAKGARVEARRFEAGLAPQTRSCVATGPKVWSGPAHARKIALDAVLAGRRRLGRDAAGCDAAQRLAKSPGHHGQGARRERPQRPRVPRP